MNRIKQIRIEKGMMQKELSIGVGVSQPTVHNWERGTMKPSAENLKKIAEVLRVSVDQLYSEQADADTEIANQPAHQEQQSALALSGQLVREMLSLTKAQQQRVLDFISGIKSNA